MPPSNKPARTVAALLGALLCLQLGYYCSLILGEWSGSPLEWLVLVLFFTAPSAVALGLMRVTRVEWRWAALTVPISLVLAFIGVLSSISYWSPH